MPNHITNRLVINAEPQKVEEVLNFLKEKNNPDKESPLIIDFNNIISMPESLNIESGGLGTLGMEYILSSEKFILLNKHDIKKRFSELSEELQEKAIDLGRKYLINLANCGFTTWYEWAVANWGTKWNAYNQVLKNENEVWFDTAWSGVHELMIKLSERFPDVEFGYSYADEDSGYNCASGTILNGVSDMYVPVGGSKEAYDIYFELNPGAEEDYELTDEGYKYIEE